MFRLRSLTSFASWSVFLYFSTQTDAVTCPPFNPSLPLSGSLRGRPAITRAAQAFRTSVEALLSDGSLLDNETTSFSVDFYALGEEGSLFNYHFSAPGLSNASEGVREVDSDTVYRLGSISKVFTVYTYLASVGDLSWNQPITKYVPELARAARETAYDSVLDVVRWEDVTLGSLAAHLSGIARQTAPNGEADQALAQAAGFPPVPPVGGTYCDGSPQLQIPCDRREFFTNLFAQHPIVPSQHAPVYSNIAYLLLAYALENMTDTRFPELMNTTILSPLSLDSTYYPLPPPSAAAQAVIPFNATTSWYATDIRAFNPGGGVYSTVNDLRAFGKSILNSTLLHPALTRRWLKPHSFTPDNYIALGAPWEILNYPPNSRFPLKIYTKAGDVGAYSTNMALLPDYNLGFTVLAAGRAPGTNSRILPDLFIRAFVPAIKRVAANQANETYSGSYASDETQSSITLSVVSTGDDVGAVLRLRSLVYNGTDLLQLYALSLGLDALNAELLVDAYPTGLVQRIQGGQQAVESWRASFNVQPLENSTTQDAASQLGAFTNSCGAWAILDSTLYGGVAIDELLFTRVRGEVVSAEVRFLREGAWERDDAGQAKVKREAGNINVDMDGLKLWMKKVKF